MTNGRRQEGPFDRSRRNPSCLDDPLLGGMVWELTQSRGPKGTMLLKRTNRQMIGSENDPPST